MTKPILSISVFTPPEQIWAWLADGHKITFHEYEFSQIPPDLIHLDDFDLVTRWEFHPRSLNGLLNVLEGNVNRLVRFRYLCWPENNEGRDDYHGLVSSYAQSIIHCMRRHYSFDRIIEAGSIYSRFINAESAFLALLSYDRVFAWREDAPQMMATTPLFKPAEPVLNPDIIEQTATYCITRQNSAYFSGSRKSLVDINAMSLISEDQFVTWLLRGFTIRYQSLTLSLMDNDIYANDYTTEGGAADFLIGTTDDISSVLARLSAKNTGSNEHTGI